MSDYKKTAKLFTIPYVVTACWDDVEEMPEHSTDEERKKKTRYITYEVILEAVDEEEAFDEAMNLWDDEEDKIVDYGDIARAGCINIDIDSKNIKECVQ